jgi:hypothetical protein
MRSRCQHFRTFIAIRLARTNNRINRNAQRLLQILEVFSLTPAAPPVRYLSVSIASLKSAIRRRMLKRDATDRGAARA